MAAKQQAFTVIVAEEHTGKRLDQALALLCPQHSRSRLQAWIKNGFVTVNGEMRKQKDSVYGGQAIDVLAPTAPESGSWVGQDMPLDIIHEDDDLIILDKSPGIIVHPGAGNPDKTLLNALLFYCPQLAQIPRAGIIQRLDKDTSGIMVVAKSLRAHRQLVKDLQSRNITREYRAVVHGRLISGGRVHAPIGRHPTQRKRMAVSDRGKTATTDYRIIHTFPAFTDIKVKLHTGRTHQIRVHMLHLGHPVVGDRLYGGRNRMGKNISPALRETITAFPRQALHACTLGLTHPETKQALSWSIPLPADMQSLLDALEHEEHARDH